MCVCVVGTGFPTQQGRRVNMWWRVSTEGALHGASMHVCFRHSLLFTRCWLATPASPRAPLPYFCLLFLCVRSCVPVFVCVCVCDLYGMYFLFVCLVWCLLAGGWLSVFVCLMCFVLGVWVVSSIDVGFSFAAWILCRCFPFLLIFASLAWLGHYCLSACKTAGLAP